MFIGSIQNHTATVKATLNKAIKKEMMLILNYRNMSPTLDAYIYNSRQIQYLELHTNQMINN